MDAVSLRARLTTSDHPIVNEDDDDGPLPPKKQKRSLPARTNETPDRPLDRLHDQSRQPEDDTVGIDQLSEPGSQGEHGIPDRAETNLMIHRQSN